MEFTIHFATINTEAKKMLNDKELNLQYTLLLLILENNVIFGKDSFHLQYTLLLLIRVFFLFYYFKLSNLQYTLLLLIRVVKI